MVEAAYRIGLGVDDWLMEISAQATPWIDQGQGCATVYWRVGPDAIDVRAINGPVSSDLLTLIPRTYEGLPRDFIAHAFSGPPWAARVSDLPPIHALLMRHVAEGDFDVGDVVAAQVGDGRGRGLTIGACASERATFPSARRRMLMRAAAHVGAALRLRGRIEDGTPSAQEAVLDPSGRVHHAEGALTTDADSRSALTEAVRRMERARGTMRRTDPEGALAAWPALVEGTWSVVDWIDGDGRRYLVAHENRLHTPDPRALTRREREVAEYLVHGRSNGEIAYALGLGEGTVNRLARAVLRKLGGARRSDLAALFGSPDALCLDASPESGLIAVSSERRTPKGWSLLSPAQREVAAMAVGGASNEAIAHARATSPRTVANLLAQCYRRVGVRGRNELAAWMGHGPAPSE